MVIIVMPLVATHLAPLLLPLLLVMPILKVIIVIQLVATHQLPVNIVILPVAILHQLQPMLPLAITLPMAIIVMPPVATHLIPPLPILPSLVTSILKVIIVMIMVATLQLLTLPLLVTIILKVIIVMLLVVTHLPLPQEPEPIPLPSSITLTTSVIHAVMMVVPAYLEINTGFTTTIATNGHAGTILHLLILLLHMVSTMQKVIIVILPVVTHLPTPPILASSITLTTLVIHAVTMVAKVLSHGNTGSTTTIATNGHAGTILTMTPPPILVATKTHTALQTGIATTP